MSTFYKPPPTVIHDQRRPTQRCVSCGDEGHTLANCPDETEGRRIARGRATTLANFDLNLSRRRPKLVEHATLCTDCGETLFGDETCESVDCPFAAHTTGHETGGRNG